jgi:formylglycine-generating enzyme required for sulfatase activity
MVLAATVWFLRRWEHEPEGARCGPGFVATGFRCCPSPGGDAVSGYCASVNGTCPSPLEAVDGHCDAPRSKVLVSHGTLVVGPSDWEAEGLVKARQIQAGPFWMDAFEVTVGRFRCPVGVPGCSERFEDEKRRGDWARAAYGVPLREAIAFCKEAGGRLPTLDEWTLAAAGTASRRYPWGDAGAVCRRGAWGLSKGPCAQGASGPDTVGAHPSGATPSGVFDLAGNVAEWALGPQGTEQDAQLRGGSWRTAFAAELRTWSWRTAAGLAEEPTLSSLSASGFRCVYDENP